MNLLVTGAELPLGHCVVSHFDEQHAVRLVGRLAKDNIERVDLCRPDQVAHVVAGADAILHLDVFNRSLEGVSEQDFLTQAIQGTFVLMDTARKAGVPRVIFASSLSLFERYPEDYVVDETWQPQPAAKVDALAPYLAEITCREFARQGGISAICLRMGGLGESEGTSHQDALKAFEGALAFEFSAPGYRWHIFHIYSGTRFPMRSAKRALRMAERGR